MRALRLYQTESDELVAVKEAFDQGGWLVPDVHTKLPQARKLFTVDEFQQIRMETRHFYIFIGPSERATLSIRKVDKDGSHLFYVSPGVGTASLEFLGGGVFLKPETHTQLIRPGFLEYSPEYWATDLSRKLASPPELASLFERLCRVVKSHSARIKPGKSIFWIGENAQSEFAKGARLVGYETSNGAPAVSSSNKSMVS